MPTINKLIDNNNIPEGSDTVFVASIGKIDILYDVKSKQICFLSNYDFDIFYDLCFTFMGKSTFKLYYNVPTRDHKDYTRVLHPKQKIFLSNNGSIDSFLNVENNNDKMIINDATFYYIETLPPYKFHSYSLDMNNQNISIPDLRLGHRINVNRIFSNFVESHQS